MSIHRLARTRPSLLSSRAAYRGVLTFFIGDAGLQWVMSSCYPRAPTSLKCSVRSTPTSPSHKMCRNPQQGAFSTSFPHNLTHLSVYLDGSLLPTPPLNFQSQITGNQAVYGFAFFSFLPDSFTVGAWPHSLSDLCARARASFGCFSGSPQL